MIVAVADTHVPIWYIFDDPRLSPMALQQIEQAEAEGHRIAISSMSLVEIVYLMEKGRVDPTTLERTKGLLGLTTPFVEIPVDLAVAEAMDLVPRHEVPDLPDRVIAATAVRIGVPVITRDGEIRASSVPTIW